MAEEKNLTAAEKRAATMKAKKEAEEAEAQASAEKKSTPKAKEEKRTITGDTEVTVFNNTSHKLIWEARKGTGYLELAQFMDSDVLTVEELQQMRNGHRAILEQGWVFVDDEEVLDHLRLSKVKDSVKSPEILTELLLSKNPTRIKEVASTLTKNSKITLNSELKRLFKEGAVSDFHVIKAVEEAIGIPADKSILSTEQ